MFVFFYLSCLISNHQRFGSIERGEERIKKKEKKIKTNKNDTVAEIKMFVLFSSELFDI